MRLTWRDAAATVLVLAGLTMALSVSQGWSWPLLGGIREAIVAMAITGLAACLVGAPLERAYRTNPFGLLTTVIAMAALAFSIVGGLITGADQFLVALTGVTVMLWLMATVRHAVDGAEKGAVMFRRAQTTTRRAMG